MTTRSKLYIVTSNFGEDYIHDEYSDEYRYQCPHCLELGKKTSDYKLYVNAKSLKFNCFRCGWHGRLEDDTVQESSNSVLGSMLKDLETKYSGISLSKDDEDYDEPTYYKLPSELLTPDNKRAWDYLIKRGITPEDISRYSIRVPNVFDSPKSMIGRVLIPNKVIAGKFTNMYVARTYINEEPKYKNPYNSPKDKVIFNYHNIPDNPDQIIINEGVLTSIVAGTDSVATYGKSVSDYQIDMIVDKNPKRVYVSLDNDAKDDRSPDPTGYKITDLVKKLLDKLPDSDIYIVNMPAGKDAVDVGRSVYRNKYLSNAVLIRTRTELAIYMGIKHLT